MKVLAITNLFGFPWDPARGVFNQQQFERLSKRVDLSVLVAIPWTEAIRHPVACWNARRDGRKRWPYVDYFVFWYVPGFAQALHSYFFFLSLLVQKPVTLFLTRWDALIGSWGFPDAAATAAIGRLTHTPTLMKVHGTDINDYLHVPSKRSQILRAARRSSVVMCPSGALRAQLVEAGIGADKVEVIYNGVDGLRFHPADAVAARSRLGLEAHEQVLLFVGNLKVAKGCIDLLEAFISVATDYPDLSLVYIGSGEAMHVIRQRAVDHGLGNRVRLLGKLDHALLPDWFAASRLLSLPSHNEGVPNVVLEAMACGVPVVASNVGGIPEVVPSMAGLLVDAHDVAALSAALRTAMSRTWDKARIAEHAGRFSWDANVERVVTLLARSIEQRGAALPKLP